MNFLRNLNSRQFTPNLPHNFYNISTEYRYIAVKLKENYLNCKMITFTGQSIWVNKNRLEDKTVQCPHIETIDVFTSSRLKFNRSNLKVFTLIWDRILKTFNVNRQLIATVAIKRSTQKTFYQHQLTGHKVNNGSQHQIKLNCICSCNFFATHNWNVYPF